MLYQLSYTHHTSKLGWLFPISEISSLCKLFLLESYYNINELVLPFLGFTLVFNSVLPYIHRALNQGIRSQGTWETRQRRISSVFPLFMITNYEESRVRYGDAVRILKDDAHRWINPSNLPRHIRVAAAGEVTENNHVE